MKYFPFLTFNRTLILVLSLCFIHAPMPLHGQEGLHQGEKTTKAVVADPVKQRARDHLLDQRALQLGDFHLKRISGGLTNHVFLVKSSTMGRMILRMSDKEADSLGIRREEPAANTKLAGEAGIGPKILYLNQGKDIMLIKFIPGRELASLDQEQSKNSLAMVIPVLRQLHSLPTFEGEFDPFQNLQELEAQAKSRSTPLPEREMQLANGIVQEIREHLLPYRPQYWSSCHNDLHSKNILLEDISGLPSFIDWDYSGKNDLFYDLAILNNSLQLSENESREFLRTYFSLGRTPGDELTLDRHAAHLYLMRMISDLWNSYWYYSQIGVSSLSSDHQENATLSLEKFLARYRSPLYRKSLEELTPNSLP